MPKFSAPYYPIIYVRGYAMTAGEIDDTTADPFCGFNLGSTLFRAVPTKDAPPRKYVFESPVVRLMSDFGYSDVYEDGYDILDPEWQQDAQGRPTDNRLSSRCIVIHRYYDESSRLLGRGQVLEIEQFARSLSRLVAHVRDLVCANPENKVAPDDFRCYLVAHSMGGLVSRAMLQNAALDEHQAARYVDKFFTYATPHNGIEVGGMNVPRWLSLFDIDNFNREKRMAKYLDLQAAYDKYRRVDLIPESRLSSRRVFCMVGTNRMDYEAAAGLSRNFVGHGSDGLVKIENATLCGLRDDGTVGDPCAKAFAFRAHSGYFGIVNSEEAFQNLTRFLFGDVRVDLWLDIDDIRLPPAVEKAAGDAPVDALYQIETLASPRGKLWYLTRRVSEEDSVACITHRKWKETRSLYLSSVFLANRARVNPRRRSLAYSMTLGVRVPDYEIDRRLWINEHYEGGYLFRDSVILEMVPPATSTGTWQVKYAWQGTGVSMPNQATEVAPLDHGTMQVVIPFGSYVQDAQGQPVPASPGIQGSLRFVVSAWNADAPLED